MISGTMKGREGVRDVMTGVVGITLLGANPTADMVVLSPGTVSLIHPVEVVSMAH